MSTRLDRLFVLIETGSSTVTRKTAAQQLGEVVKLHPYELQPLLERISILLHSNVWDTRIAAAQAVEAICMNTHQRMPSAKSDVDALMKGYEYKCLSLDTFDINSVLNNYRVLMASDITQFDKDAAVLKNECHQLKLISQQLNMGLINQDPIVTAEDLTTSTSTNLFDKYVKDKKLISEFLNIESDIAHLKAVYNGKRQILQLRDDCMEETKMDGRVSSCKKKLSDESDEGDMVVNTNIDDVTMKSAEILNEETALWPFELFSANMRQNLFNMQWEIRHGAAVALREVVKEHGKSASTCRTNIPEENNQQWLENLSVYLLSVLALDRFCDFISDHVVAPVRESCAQCLSVVAKLMDKIRMKKLINLLIDMLRIESVWEVRHSALLGIKYILAVRGDMLDDILPEIVPIILKHLTDPVDDICAEAALSLDPISKKIIKLRPDLVPEIIRQLWKLLSEQDELGVACKSFMKLLASLFLDSEQQTIITSEMTMDVIPRLWPFLSHFTSSVRTAAVQTILNVTNLRSSIFEWRIDFLQTALQHLFQRALFEPNEEIRMLIEAAWINICKNSTSSTMHRASEILFGTWLCMAMQPSKIAFDFSLILNIKTQMHDSIEEDPELKCYIGGDETISPNAREQNVIPIRCMLSRMLGHLLNSVLKQSVFEENVAENEGDTRINYYLSILLSHLNSKSALRKTISGLVIIEWGYLNKSNENFCPNFLITNLQNCLLESIYFDEIAIPYTKLLHDTTEYIMLLKKHGVSCDPYENKILRLNEIILLTNEEAVKSNNFSRLKKEEYDDIEEKRRSILSCSQSLLNEQNMLFITAHAVIAGTVLVLNCLPEKINPVIKPLMDSIRKEESEPLQQLSAAHVAQLVCSCINREPCPNAKIIANLCSWLCSDPEYTPKISKMEFQENSGENIPDKHNGIITLFNYQKGLEKIGRKVANNVEKCFGRMNSVVEETSHSFVDKKFSKIQRRGATLALIKVAQSEKDSLPNTVPSLWDLMYTFVLEYQFEEHEETMNEELAEKLICSLQILEVLSPYIDDKYFTSILDILPHICKFLTSKYCSVRHMASRCIASLADRNIVSVMLIVVRKVLPLIDSGDSVIKRQGSIEAVAVLADTLNLKIIPYIVLLIIPLMGCMSDQDSFVRSMASLSFGTLIQLIPLNSSAFVLTEMPDELSTAITEQHSFLNNLLNPNSISDFKLSVDIKATLRSYQRNGINWLLFLNKYRLHGILCDDMGLGKTLQSLCILAEDHYNYELKRDKSNSPPIPSVVVCPPTLIGHWMFEVNKFISQQYIRCLQYEGIPTEREKLQKDIQYYNLVIVSYDIVRKDIDFFSGIKWNYCILDEGHIIKNGRTKISKAIKQLVASHRLILSGTPIQNNVLELWSLFDFLMPGYLGNEKQFNVKFSKPILMSKDPKSTIKDQEAGVLAMEALHHKVLPFILRRMKEDVLNDLPPKITQDYYCDLSPLQQLLYEDFAKEEVNRNVLKISNSNPSPRYEQTSMFRALRYLQYVCNHPKLVLTKKHPLYKVVMERFHKDNFSDINHAAKLVALKQLLIDCGIGVGSVADDGTVTADVSSCVVSQHRALIFCQLKVMLNILETDLFQKHLQNVTYLRIDGSVPVKERQRIITTFNNDPSIDVLLLTTHIGGLGLNLVGADTVIFVEHDWSPMRDLQAMDRVHRIGQKKVVNVYRLITRGTLEEKIMGLQKFKLKTATTVINSENSSLSTMSTEKLLDLFTFNKPSKYGNRENTVEENEDDGASTSQLMFNPSEYEEEYDMQAFVDRVYESHLK